MQDNSSISSQSVHGGRRYTDPGFASDVLARRINGTANTPATLIATLTPREREVVTLAAEGMTNKEIARQFDLAEKTVKHHMTSILGKLHARNRVEASIIARRELTLGGS